MTQRPMFKNTAATPSAAAPAATRQRNQIFGYINISIPRKNGSQMRLPSSNISADLAIGEELHNWLMADPKNVETFLSKLVISYQANNTTNSIEDLDLGLEPESDDGSPL